jgi:protein gp37
MSTSKIEWTESTWNPVTGCTKISTGCKNCYAERMAFRLNKMGAENYRNGFKVTLHEHMMDRPLSWKKPRMIFVNSMSDLFHEDVPDDFILRVFGVMRKARWHTFQILTKRSERLLDINSKIHWPKNVWMGVSIENSDCTFRAEDLKKTGSCVKFLSMEPLLGSVREIVLEGIDWVIVGGESGPGARIMKEEWALEIKRKCHVNGIPFFFKQWGGVNKKKAGRTLQGQLWDEMPDGDYSDHQNIVLAV